MRAVVVSEKYLEERFEAFINKVKVGFDERNFLNEGERGELVRLFNYCAHEFKREIVGGPDRDKKL